MAKSKRRSSRYPKETVLNYEFNSWVKDTMTIGVEEREFTTSGKIQTTKFITPKTTHQRRFVDSIKNNFITLGVGYPGTGKTLLALHTGVCLVNSQQSSINKIIYVRANVCASFERSMGYLPGELGDKTLFMADPIMDNLTEFMTEQSAKFAVQKEKIVVRPVDMLRGRSFRDCVIIIEEAQNIPAEYIKMLLTRAGENSKIILIGDMEQVDLKGFPSGLKDCLQRLMPLKDEGIIPMGVILFDNPEDIQRNAFLSAIIEAYAS